MITSASVDLFNEFTKRHSYFAFTKSVVQSTLDFDMACEDAIETFNEPLKLRTHYAHNMDKECERDQIAKLVGSKCFFIFVHDVKRNVSIHLRLMMMERVCDVSDCLKVVCGKTG